MHAGREREIIMNCTYISLRGRRRSHYFTKLATGSVLAAPSFSLYERLACVGTFFHQVPDTAGNDPLCLFADDHLALIHFDDRSFHCSNLTSAP